jgi:hypothetical protein
MPSSPIQFLDPLVDRTHYFAFPPVSTAAIPDMPPTTPPTVSAFESTGQEVEAGGEIVPLNELRIQMGQSNPQVNYDQMCEGQYQAYPIVDPSLTMDPYYEHSSYLPIRETISPYLLDFPGDVNYCGPSSSNLHNMGILDVDFDDTPLDGVPDLTCNRASPQIGGTLTTPKPIDASPPFSVHDTRLALDRVEVSCGGSPMMENSLPQDLLGLESVNFPTIYNDISLQTQSYALPSQLCNLPADNMIFDYVSEFNTGLPDAQLGQTIASSLDDMYQVGADDFFDDNTADWRVQSTESPMQDMSRKHSKGRSAQRDTSKDELLISCKAQGMSYKQIKELGGFEEAESTLRGRYRALTKPREARLRKPEWGKREVSTMDSL